MWLLLDTPFLMPLLFNPPLLMLLLFKSPTHDAAVSARTNF